MSFLVVPLLLTGDVTPSDVIRRTFQMRLGAAGEIRLVAPTPEDIARLQGTLDGMSIESILGPITAIIAALGGPALVAAFASRVGTERHRQTRIRENTLLLNGLTTNKIEEGKEYLKKAIEADAKVLKTLATVPPWSPRWILITAGVFYILLAIAAVGFAYANRDDDTLLISGFGGACAAIAAAAYLFMISERSAEHKKS